jgi:hypothetical protein
MEVRALNDLLSLLVIKLIKRIFNREGMRNVAQWKFMVVAAERKIFQLLYMLKLCNIISNCQLTS